MLHRWKLILANWVNCYFNETSQNEKNLNTDLLLSIISHLRENFNLDESKSSILEAHTVEEFICEKYPEFIFENGTVEAATEEEICLSASLLLFFVCVNSKNLDIKSAMCSKLNSEDQKTILKYSKCLMKCPVVTVNEVQAAITEACGQDIAAMELELPQVTVTATPPALRSLHSEVRKLQAALDAERFDRNYLQEELTRINNRLEHSLKEKEEYKLHILNLKAKISLCCGQEDDVKNAEASADKSSQLTLQLQHLEQRLEETQTQLDDMVYERDTYKSKIDELKNDRDKWFAMSQEDSARVTQLSDELDLERRQVKTLRDLVEELQQHNKLNGLDSSSLECDDPDTSIQLLQQNYSFCSEVCTNVVEVQLGEERAKIVVLKQQIVSLQEQINELNQDKETEKNTLENVIAQRENDIFNLKHRINEEIEEKNNLKAHCDNEMTKLNNEINELEQNLKDNNEHSRSVIEKKMTEIQILQEEKLSLIQSLNNETTKLENVVRDLKSELESEKQARSNMREGYENHLMKLNEKVLNRNNELVELQNSIFEKGEMIETLQIELRKEKEVSNELKNKYQNLDKLKNSIENELQLKTNEVQDLKIKIQHSHTVLEDKKAEIIHMETSIALLNKKIKDLELLNNEYVNEIRNRDSKIEETLKDLNYIKEVFTKEKEKLSQDMDERNATVNYLQNQLQSEVQFKVGLQNELAQLHIENSALSEKSENHILELSKLKIDIEDKDRTIEAIDLYIQEQKKLTEQANENIQKMTDDIIAKENNIKILHDELDATTKQLEKEVKKNEDNAEVATTKLLTEIAERETLQLQLGAMFMDKSQIEEDLSLKCEEILLLQEECKILSQKLDESETLIQVLEQKRIDECNKIEEIHSKFISETSTMHDEMENTIFEATKIMEHKLKEKESLLNKLCSDLGVITKVYEKTIYNLKSSQKENENLAAKLNEEMSLKSKLEEEYQNRTIQFEMQIAQFEDEISARNTDMQQLQNTLWQNNKSNKELLCEADMEIGKLKNEITKLQSTQKDMEQDFTKEIEMKTQTINALEIYNKELQTTTQKLNSNIDTMIKEKDKVIEKLEQQVKSNIIKFEDLKEHTDEVKYSWETYKAEAKAAIKEKEDKIAQLNEMALTFEQKINEVEQEKGELSKKIAAIEENKKIELCNIAADEKALRDILESEKETLTKENISLLSQNDELLAKNTAMTQALTEERSAKIVVENEMRVLFSEKENLSGKLAILVQELAEERSVKKIAVEEKMILLTEKTEIKQQLAEEIKTTGTLLQERDCLAQQLIEEKSAKEITEKEKELLIAEKELMEEKIVESEKTKSTLCQKVNNLNRQIEVLQLDLKKEKKALFILRQEHKKLSEDMSEQKTCNGYLLENNQSLANENDQLKKDLHKMTTNQEILKAEKESLEMALHNEKSTRDEMETEKYNLDIKVQLDLINKEEEYKSLFDKCKKLQETFENDCKKYVSLIEDKERLLLDMRNSQENLKTENESLVKALSIEKSISEQVQLEKNALAHKLESELVSKEEEKRVLRDEIEKLNANLVKLKLEQDAFIKEKDLVVAEKEYLVKSHNIEKCANNEIKTEQKDLIIKLDHYEKLCNEYVCNIAMKEREVQQLETTLKQVEISHQCLEETNVKITTAAREKLDKLVQKISEENIWNDYFHNLIKQNNFNDITHSVACDLIFKIADVLASEVSVLKKLEVTLRKENATLSEIEETLKQKESQVCELQTEIKQMVQKANESKIELLKQSENYATSMNSKINDILLLQQENQNLHNDLNDVKVQLEVKVHSLKEKLTDNEDLTDKLKNTYECQIDNLNLMITKLTNFLREKTMELGELKKDKDLLQQTVEDSCKVIKTLEGDLRTEKQNLDQLRSEFESEHQVLTNMVTANQTVVEDTNIRLNNEISELSIAKDCLELERNALKNLVKDLEKKYSAQEMANASLFSLLKLERKGKQDVEKESEIVREYLDEVISHLNQERNANMSVVSALEFQERISARDLKKMKDEYESTLRVNHDLRNAGYAFENEIASLQEQVDTVLKKKTEVENESRTHADMLTKVLKEKSQVEQTLQETVHNLIVVQLEIKELKSQVSSLIEEKNHSESEKQGLITEIETFKSQIDEYELQEEELAKLKNENQLLLCTVEDNRTVITNLEQLIKHELEENHKLRDDNEKDKMTIASQSSQLQDYQKKAAKEIDECQAECVTLKKEIEILQTKLEICEQDSRAKDGFISTISKEKDAVISTMSKELVEEKAAREKYEKELETQKSIVTALKDNMEIKALKKENEQLIRAIGQQETLNLLCQENSAEKHSYKSEHRDQPQVDHSSSDNTHSSVESLKTITDLEKIIHDKNRTITTLQTDITFIKTMMAESETKLLDVNRELEISKENCQQLSNQLKKIAYQKNEEIAELKKHLSKMSVTENRASQIIKVSAKYQAMILKRIAEIKSNTVLKELTNFGNSNNCDNELKRSLNAGTITMEDLENFLETTDRHLKRCSEKQIALQKERDRLTEVNRIHESEIINLKKFLTELSVSFQTFSSVKDVYGHKLSRVISIQRTVRREILNLDGRISDSVMCRLERGYGAVMQDLAECTMNLERWVERCISRTVSVEKIKQAFISDSERSSLASPSFQNTGLEVHLEELEKSFQKLLEEVARAVKGDGAKESQATTVMEVRAEYEDKLNRMKAKMKDLFNEQMAVLKGKQRDEISLLERELQKTRDRMEESRRAYEKHIRELTKELWSVGEKYLVKNDEAEWLKRKQQSGSLMSLQHVHSSGLVPQEVPSRPSDAHSLRSLPVTDNTKSKREGRGLHMSDEEGEVFDNRWLKELSATPRRDVPPGQRLSELKWRNSLCPPHLKSSYPAETQFAPVLDEEEIKAGAASAVGRTQRKEVGITAYKKPGPPTPSKQAGRLSATDSELRESLRGDIESHPHAERKISTPARFRAFLRLNKNDTNEGTPRTRRLSNIFRKKQ